MTARIIGDDGGLTPGQRACLLVVEHALSRGRPLPSRDPAMLCHENVGLYCGDHWVIAAALRQGGRDDLLLDLAMAVALARDLDFAAVAVVVIDAQGRGAGVVVERDAWRGPVPPTPGNRKERRAAAAQARRDPKVNAPGGRS